MAEIEFVLNKNDEIKSMYDMIFVYTNKKGETERYLLAVVQADSVGDMGADCYVKAAPPKICGHFKEKITAEILF